VAAGELITAEGPPAEQAVVAHRHEHNAVHQLSSGRADGGSGAHLAAASGGPFLYNTGSHNFLQSQWSRRLNASHVENGATDHHRLGNPNEQGI